MLRPNSQPLTGFEASQTNQRLEYGSKFSFYAKEDLLAELNAMLDVSKARDLNINSWHSGG